MASFPKRARSRSLTEVVCTPGEQETLRASSAVPPEQQRLVFGPCSPVVVPCGGQDPLFVELQSTQAIIFQDTRALGCLVKPRVLVDSPGELAPVSLVSLIYDYWQPASSDRKHGQLQHLRIPLDSRYCSTSVFSIRAILTGSPHGNVPLPGHHEWSGSKTAAAVNQHQQRLDYIRTQQRLFTEGEGKDSPNRHLLARSDAEYTIDTGPEWEASSLSLTFNTAAELPWLQRIILRLLVIPKAPVDDNGGPIGDTRAEVTHSSLSAGASGLVGMASASTQPVPQGHSGKHQSGGGTKQPAEDQLQQAARQRETASTSSPVVDVCVSDTGAAHVGAAATSDAIPETGPGFLSPAITLTNSGGTADSCLRGAAQSSRSAGGGGEPHGSSDSEDEGAARGQSGSGQGRGAAGGGAGGGTGSGGDRGDPGRERGQEPLGASPKNGRKQKQKHESEATEAEANGTESPQPAPGSCSHSDRDAAASLQEASSRSTTMDTADASSDAADEQQLGVTESKPTVKLIPNGPGCTLRQEGSPHAAASDVSGAAVLALHARRSCAADGDGSKDRGGDSGAEGGATAADARVCTSGCCGGDGASTADAGDSSGPGGTPGAATGADQAEGDGSGRASARPNSVRQDLEAAASESATADAAAAPTPAAEATPAAAKVSSTGPVGDAGAADGACSGARDFANSSLAAQVQPPPPPPSQPSHLQQRSYPNGATWAQPHVKGSTHAVEAQQHVMGAAAAAAVHVPHVSHYGVHGHPLQNGKVRNGELPPDAAMWAQQLLPGLATYASMPGQGAGHGPGSGSATPPPIPAQPGHHQQSSGQAHAYSNGLEMMLLQQLLLAQQNGALQLQQQGMQLGCQHGPPGLGVYGLPYLQQAQAQHHQHQQHQQQQHHQHQQFLQQAQLLQQQLLQAAVHAQQAQAQHHAQQQQQQQQLFMQGLAHAHLAQAQADAQYMVAASAAEPTTFSSLSRASSATQLPASPAVQSSAAQELTAPQSEGPVQQQQHTQGAAQSVATPLNPSPIIAPTPAVAQQQGAGAQGDSTGQQTWDSGSASSVRSEPSTAVAAPLVERPMGPQHRVQSQGNMLSAAQQGGGGSGTGSQREGAAGGRPSSYRGRTSISGIGGPPSVPGGGGGGGSGSGPGSGGANAVGQPSVLMQGGGTYGGRPYPGPAGSARHGGGGGGHGYRGGRYDGGSADNSRPSSRGPNPHGGGGGGGGGSHTRHSHPADPVPPPEALPLPDPKGSCDLDRFISQIEPVIAIDPAKPPQQALQELRLRDLWNFYFEPSLYGREVFTLGGHRGASNSYFVPYLSAIQIFTRALPTDVGGTNRLYVSEDNQGWPKHMHLKFEYFEQELPFNRLPLYDQIELLSNMMAAGKFSGFGPGPGGATAGGQPAGNRPAAGTATTAANSTTASAATPVPAPAASGPVPSAAPAPAQAKEVPDVHASAEVVGAAAHTAESGEIDDTAAASVDRNPSSGAKPGPNCVKAGGEGVPPASNAAQTAATAVEGAIPDGGQGDTKAVDGAAAVATPSAISAGPAPPSPPRQAGPAAAPTPAPVAQDGEAGSGSNSNAGSGLLYDMRLLDVHPASWFAVAWYPVYRIPDAPLYARFLTFHSFAPLVESMRNVHERLAMGQVAPYYLLSLPVVGLNWYNMQGERWMEPLDESAVARAFNGGGPPPPVAASAPAASVNSPRGPHHRGGGGRVPGTDVWYQHLLQSYQSTADRLARGLGLKVLGQHGAEEVRLRVPDYEFFRARS